MHQGNRPTKGRHAGWQAIRDLGGLETLSQRATEFVSGPWGTLAVLGLVFAWLVAGLVMGWSRAYQLAETFITVTSFMLLFLIQRSQSKDTKSLQIKLNELLAAVNKASPELINIEDRGEGEVSELHQRYQEVQEQGPGSHSIEEVAPELCKPRPGSLDPDDSEIVSTS